MTPLSPEVRAGRLLMVGFEGAEAPAALIERAREGRIGGVILFARNIESAPQTAALIASLQEAARASPEGLPLLVGIDQEGGRVNRLSADFTTFPAARAFGDAGDPSLAREAARITGAELAAVGVNLNFAPVLDALSNPACAVIGNRAFGASPVLVGRMGAAVIEGLQKARVAACAKHFPGIGGMAPDPHEVLPTSRVLLDDLRACELEPFRRVIGRRPPACVMAAHALYEEIDASAPASLSPRFMRELLRGELGFGGAAFTDDLDMGAIANPAEAALRAIRAGADMALICHSEKAQEEALAAIARALREGDLPAARAAASAARLRSLAQAHRPLGLEESGEREKALKIVGDAAHRRARERILAALERAPAAPERS